MKREEVIYCLKAQSERYSEVCEECPLYGQTGVDHCCEDALQMAITTLQNQPVWIPVSERLPGKGVQVLCCNKHGNVFTSCVTAKNRNNYKFGKHYDVIAWMLLPETYRESEEEDVEV
nr:MAG TPA: Protein of unknown function (DUF551) [Bacteriophage sp.]